MHVQLMKKFNVEYSVLFVLIILNASTQSLLQFKNFHIYAKSLFCNLKFVL